MNTFVGWESIDGIQGSFQQLQMDQHASPLSLPCQKRLIILLQTDHWPFKADKLMWPYLRGL